MEPGAIQSPLGACDLPTPPTMYGVQRNCLSVEMVFRCFLERVFNMPFQRPLTLVNGRFNAVWMIYKDLQKVFEMPFQRPLITV